MTISAIWCKLGPVGLSVVPISWVIVGCSSFFPQNKGDPFPKKQGVAPSSFREKTLAWRLLTYRLSTAGCGVTTSRRPSSVSLVGSGRWGSRLRTETREESGAMGKRWRRQCRARSMMRGTSLCVSGMGWEPLDSIFQFHTTQWFCRLVNSIHHHDLFLQSNQFGSSSLFFFSASLTPPFNPRRPSKEWKREWWDYRLCHQVNLTLQVLYSLISSWCCQLTQILEEGHHFYMLLSKCSKHMNHRKLWRENI